MHGCVYTFTQPLKGHAPGTLGLNINLMDGCWGLGDSPLAVEDQEAINVKGPIVLTMLTTMM